MAEWLAYRGQLTRLSESPRQAFIFAGNVYTDRRVRKLYPKVTQLYQNNCVDFVNNRGRSAWGGYIDGDLYLRLPGTRIDKGTTLHEIAHTIHQACFYAHMHQAHGKEYCQIYLTLIKWFLGKEMYRRMINAFDDMGVDYILKERERSRKRV